MYKCKHWQTSFCVYIVLQNSIRKQSSNTHPADTTMFHNVWEIQNYYKLQCYTCCNTV